MQRTRPRHRPARACRPAGGFTLIEVMITVAIIGILTAIALPSYTDYIRRSRIPEATSNLAGTQVRMEQYYQDAKSYYTSSSNTACGVAMPTGLKYFTVTCATSNSGNSYLITATGTGPMVGFSYTVDQDGTRTSAVAGVSSAWNATSANCWIVNKGGTC